MAEWFRFIHVADTHCGYSGGGSRYGEFESMNIPKRTKNEIPIRQADAANAFEQVIDIAINNKVDAVLHAGDGMDSWGYKRPNVLNQYTTQISRLYQKGIKYVEIAGNHNLPKEEGIGCYLETLNLLPHVHTIYQNKYEKVNLDDDIVVHCIPSTTTHDYFQEAINSVKKEEGKLNIGLGHFGVTEIDFYAKNSDKSLVVNLKKLKEMDLDYFALGDYHKTVAFTDRIRYSGSTERFSFSDVDNEPKVLLIEIHKKTKELKVTEIPLSVRPMIVLPTIDASKKTINSINEEIFKTIQSQDITDAMVRLRVENLPKHLKTSIELEKVKELTSEALYTKIELMSNSETHYSSPVQLNANVEFKDVLTGWDDFMNRVMEKTKKEDKFGLNELFNDILDEDTDEKEYEKEVKKLNEFTHRTGRSLIEDILETKKQEE